MPHVIVKLMAGRPDELKQRLADELTKAVVAALGGDGKSVSVAVEDIAPRDWTEKVYKPDILGRPGSIFKQPGYDPL